MLPSGERGFEEKGYVGRPLPIPKEPPEILLLLPSKGVPHRDTRTVGIQQLCGSQTARFTHHHVKVCIKATDVSNEADNPHIWYMGELPLCLLVARLVGAAH